MEIPKIYKSLFPKCILSKYLLKIYVQTLYLIFDYPYKYYTFKLFEV